ncbi:transmembrane 4 L6 family member 5 [Triplophysa rosa]|uniref:transmembrane 4 L6 family member 5 n=1 Tax=Triplophysa rosa TaxID=992332 RepID=UPI0025462D60|nr:transmembrane 4 L6 family member 5 [Triplophysa rosa]
MCISRCSRCLGMALIPMAVVCMVANVLLLFPDMNYRYLIEHHVTKEALWCCGIWASGFLVLVAVRGLASHSDQKGCCYFRAQMFCKFGYTCLALLAAGFCFMVSGTGLVLGPLCLHNGTQGLKWERPLKQVNHGEKLYLHEPDRWASACEEPRGVVIWNVVLFSMLMAASGLQLIFCAVHLLTTILGVICGPSFCKNKVFPA